MNTDIQFCLVLGAMTDLKRNQIYSVFDMLDIDGSGQIDFDEFYLLTCILISLKVKTISLILWLTTKPTDWLDPNIHISSGSS